MLKINRAKKRRCSHEKSIFPYMGYHTSRLKSAYEIRNEVIVPPKPTMETISFGKIYRICMLPFKIVWVYVQVLEAGADTLVSSGGVGPCQAGLYTTLRENIKEPWL